MSKILLIAPVPSHPSTSGASARVRHMAQVLLLMGHEVHFLYLQEPLGATDQAMQEYWRDRLHVFRGLSPASWIPRGRRKLLRAIGKTLQLNLPVDGYFDRASANYVHRLAAGGGFDVAIVSYVFYSRLLEFMPPAVLKIIDTHDVFADRYRLYREHGQSREFFSTASREEGRALDRADIVLAIQDSDASHFRSLTKTPVAVVGHVAPPIDPVGGDAAGSDPVLLFVGSSMGINAHGMTWFIDHVFPAVRREVAGAELWLVGSICRRLGNTPTGVRRWGIVEPLDDLYRRAAVVINPQQFGTGLSIKGVDALLHGRPLVTTASGARGLEDGAGTAFLQADSAGHFAGLVVELLRDPARRAALAARAAEFGRHYHRRNLQALADVVSRRAVSLAGLRP